MRLDLFIKNEYGYSREYSKNLIESGKVTVNGIKKNIKPSFKVTDSDEITLAEGTELKYVGRGGYKLEKALEAFSIDLKGKKCIDVGASTGGFTDCMLQNGAIKVYAVDVGHGQLAWKLRQDERVVCMEKTNIRYVENEDIADKIEFSSIDVSFISLTKVLLPVKNLLTADGRVVCLIKPQFEAGREKVGKKGVVRDKAVHCEVIEKVIEYAIEIGFKILNLDFSPIKGPEGNIEYLLYLENGIPDMDIDAPECVDVNEIVDMAHGELDK